jgi:hypothetical protein
VFHPFLSPSTSDYALDKVETFISLGRPSFFTASELLLAVVPSFQTTLNAQLVAICCGANRLTIASRSWDPPRTVLRLTLRSHLQISAASPDLPVRDKGLLCANFTFTLLVERHCISSVNCRTLASLLTDIQFFPFQLITQPNYNIDNSNEDSLQVSKESTWCLHTMEPA